MIRIMTKRVWIIILLMAITLPLSAQRFRAFSNDPSLTKEEMKTFAATVPKEKQKEAMELAAKFDQLWDSPQMEEEYQETFIEMSNLMLRKNLRFFPHFEAFIDAFDAFINSDLSEQHRTWMKIVKYHIDNDLSGFHRMMENYSLIFRENILHKTPNCRWTVYGPAISMGMDKEPYFEYDDVDLVGAGSRDSVEIISTAGRYYPASTRWVGGQGTIYWYRAGLDSKVKASQMIVLKIKKKKSKAHLLKKRIIMTIQGTMWKIGIF